MCALVPPGTLVHGLPTRQHDISPFALPCLYVL